MLIGKLAYDSESQMGIIPTQTVVEAMETSEQPWESMDSEKTAEVRVRHGTSQPGRVSLGLAMIPSCPELRDSQLWDFWH